MRAVEGTNVHAEIIGLIDRAKQFVILVSPFVRPWPDFKVALAKATLRGVRFHLVCGHTVQPSHLDVFERLEIPMDVVVNLHAKLYLSEREALITSANLTRSSVERSVENGILTDREGEPDNWIVYFEQYQQVLDRAAPPKRPHQIDTAMLDAYLRGDIHALDDTGDPEAQTDRRYCISCGEIASDDDTARACLKCIAMALVQGNDEVTGAVCTVCKASAPGRTEEKPRCTPCYKKLGEVDNQPRAWAVRGGKGNIEAWYAIEEVEGAALASDAPVRAAVARRSPLYFAGVDTLSVTLRTAVAASPLSLIGNASVMLASVPKLTRLAIERVPRAATPPQPLSVATAGVLHVCAQATTDVGKFEGWTETDPLATVTIVGVPQPSSMQVNSAVSMLGLGALRFREVLAPPNRWPEEPYYLAVHMGFSLPKSLWNRWMEIAQAVLPWLTTALHQHDPADVAALLKGTASAEWAQRLSEPAPLGRAHAVRDGTGRVTRLGGDDRRIAALFILRAPATDERVGLVARVATITRPKVH